ncbi:tripartite tricarboxylate transporter substrate binding protein [Limnohabitans sp.]|uniref:Bug family tripartite tricarboxylate transporter substrate binding protein n=1 Tax=Limnohabitans sp. TaxID=1907725 RepID=UPI0025C5ED22|nr:tripartite tricarboxylate transporter substrate-binding protein [Limnohabitans sp.]
MKHLLIRLGQILVASLALTTILAQAQDAWPARPIKLLVGFAPGGSSDMVARLIATPLGERLGQPVVVENRAGAGGNIAADAVAKAASDGYTLVLLPSGHSSNAAMKKNLPFDAVNDFAWISTVTTYPLTLSVRPDSPISSFKDFIDRVKNEPNRYTYTSVGVGTAMHLFGEWLMAESGGAATHVPFRGGTAPMMELLAGRVDVMIDTMTTTAPLFKDKRVRVLATTVPAGQQALPGVPAVADSFAGVVFDSWLGVAATKGTPPAVVERLNRELRAVLDQPAIKQRLIDWGGSPRASTPSEFRNRVEGEIRQLSKIVTERKIEAQ